MAHLNSSLYTPLEKQTFLLLLLAGEDIYKEDCNFAEVQIDIIPFEDPYIKLKKMFIYLLVQKKNPIMPFKLQLMLSHFQNFTSLSSDSSMVEILWIVLNFLTSKFSSKECINRLFETSIHFIERVDSNFYSQLTKLETGSRSKIRGEP